MLSNHLGSQGLDDVYSLALTESQTRLRILDNSRLFSKSKEKHVVELIQFGSDTSQSPKTFAFKDASQLSAHLLNGEQDLSRHHHCMNIYSVHQQHTWAPLNTSQDMITTLINYYSISCGLFNMMTCFRARCLATEEGFSGASRAVSTADQSEFGWVYKYSEKKEVKTGNPWVIRHTGIYHIYNPEKMRSTLIFINPSPTAYFRLYLQKILQQSHVRSTLLSSPMLAHTMLISSHLSSWQDYLEYHETLLLKLDMKSACTALEDQLVSFETLKEVRIIEKRILPVEPLLTSFDEIVHDLQEAGEGLSKTNATDQDAHLMIQQAFKEFRKEAMSYKNRSLYLQKRAQLTAQSVLDSLNLGFQQLAKDQSQNTFLMAKSAREDSVAIRAITLVTSFYLPFSFVATMFGMNLVDFDPDSRSLLVSNQLWLYFVISVPLTVATLACWRWRMRTYRKGYLEEERKAEKCTRSMDNNSDIEMV